MAKNKKRKKKISQRRVSLKPHNYIRQKARRLPIFKCLVNDDWLESGLAMVMVARQRMNGHIVGANYLIDTHCLGLKETSYVYDISSFEFDDLVNQTAEVMELDLIEIDSTLAFNIIYGAIEYAEDIGFSPHKDFRVTEYLLDDVESIEVIDIEFGKNGKPFYVSGPYDDVEKILSVLDRNLGQGNYSFSSPYEEEYVLPSAFPQEKIDQNFERFEGDAEIAYDFQLTVASFVYDMLNGDFRDLDFDEAFYSEVVEATLDEMVDLDEEMISLTEGQVDVILNKIERYGGIDFLFEDDYNPIPQILTDEEAENLTEEEYNRYHEKILDEMTGEERSKYIFSQAFIQYLVDEVGIDDKGNLHQLDKVKLQTGFIKYMNENVLSDIKIEEENYDFIAEVIEDSITILMEERR